jgi:TP901-1 family phage major tail protein
MAIVNATDIVVKIKATAGNPTDTLLHATSASLSISQDLRDSTTKSSGGFQENLAGLRSWEVSGDGFVDFTTTTTNTINTTELIGFMLEAQADAVVEVSFGVGATTYDGLAFLTSLSMDAGVEENATYSVSLQGTGALALQS